MISTRLQSRSLRYDSIGMPFVKSVIFVVRMMKKRVGIILTFIFCLLLTSCGGLRDLSITSFRVASAGINGLNGVDVTLEVRINNPSAKMEVSDMEAVVKMHGEDVLLLSCGDLTIHGRSEEAYMVPCKARTAEGVGVLKVLKLMGENLADTEDVLVDAKARVKMGIVNKKVEYTDIPLDTIVEDF